MLGISQNIGVLTALPSSRQFYEGIRKSHVGNGLWDEAMTYFEMARSLRIPCSVDSENQVKTKGGTQMNILFKTRYLATVISLATVIVGDRSALAQDASPSPLQRPSATEYVAVESDSMLFESRGLETNARGADRSNPFDQNQTTIWIHADRLKSFGDEKADLSGVAVEIAHTFRKNLALDVEFAGYSEEVHEDSHDSGSAGRFGFGLRWAPLRVSPYFTPWLFARTGIIMADEAIPLRGTKFNFISQVGLGGALRVTDRMYLTGEAGVYHISNGGLSEVNPGVDGWTANMGVMFPY